MSTKLIDELDLSRRRREDALRNYAIYYLKIDPAGGAGTARDVTPEHSLFEIAHLRDLHSDAATGLLVALQRETQQRVEGLSNELAQTKRVLVGLTVGTLVAALTAVVAAFIR